MPYRIDIAGPPPGAFDILVDLGALDIDVAGDRLAVIVPDGLSPELIASKLPGASLSVSPAVGRDDGSVWLLSPRQIEVGGLVIAPPESSPAPNLLRLYDSPAFGTGRHPTTMLCLEALAEIVKAEPLPAVLDVGTGSGILALAALTLGVPKAAGVDVDALAIQAAARNAKLNHLAARFRLVHGGPEAIEGCWPLVIANVLATPLIEMAPDLVKRVASRGILILSGIHSSLEPEVRRAYHHFGMRQLESRTRDGWTMALCQASW